MEEKVKEEALDRMSMLNLSDKVIEDFEKSIIYISEEGGILKKVEDDTKISMLIKDIEKTHDVFVYHVIVSKMNFGDCINLLYVDYDTEDWGFENNCILYGRVSAYVFNLEESWRSEFGFINVTADGGALVRLS